MEYSGDRLKKCREDKGLSQEDLMKELVGAGVDISRQTLSKWESGDTFPPADDLAKLAMYFGKSPTYFFV